MCRTVTNDSGRGSPICGVLGKGATLAKRSSAYAYIHVCFRLIFVSDSLRAWMKSTGGNKLTIGLAKPTDIVGDRLLKMSNSII